MAFHVHACAELKRPSAALCLSSQFRFFAPSSSDGLRKTPLRDRVEADPEPLTTQGPHFALCWSNQPATYSILAIWWLGRRLMPCGSSGTRTSTVDRKSTRLNSSHPS